MKMKLIYFLSKSLVLSRRKLCEYINLGLITVNNQIAESYSQIVDSELDIIKFKDKELSFPENYKKHYFLFYKPKYMTIDGNSLQEMRIRTNVKDLKFAGRLDADSEGLLVMSNDGEFINKIMNPKEHIKKIYKICLKGFKNSKQIEELQNLIKILDYKIEKEEITMTIELSEGKNRQIRRICASCALNVICLLRISIGKFSLGNLKENEFISITL